MTGPLELLRRAVRKPPRVVLARAASEVRRAWEAFDVPRHGARLPLSTVLRDTGTRNLEELWQHLIDRPYPALHGRVEADRLDALCPNESTIVLSRADAACRREVRLLGSDVMCLGTEIDWHRDYKTGYRWSPRFYGDVRYGDPAVSSDVKVPWELSRLQWLMPAGQAYMLTGDEMFAHVARDVLDSWITANPYGCSVNWTCTMEVALRVLSWTWFFHVFAASRAWDDSRFRERFVECLYAHGHFIAEHLEYSDVNGNHYTANAAGLVFAGLFFSGAKRSARWRKRGWSILECELPRQVFADGVDFEASTAYHRLVTELFFLPALYRSRSGLDVPDGYRGRVKRMAGFAAAYSLPSGGIPLWGDADDGRALPLGTQPLNDHRYLAGWIGAAWTDPELIREFSGNRSEILWSLGVETAAMLPDSAHPCRAPVSLAFHDGGVFIMRSANSHVFIDCGPVGLAGRGGHGHNDCLALSAFLDGAPIVTDCGSYVYTASYPDRQAFRSTNAHNTPGVDDEEMNRFISPVHLWSLHDDARPELRMWKATDEVDVFVGAHSGYRRLPSPVTPVRTIVLDHRTTGLFVSDVFEGAGIHRCSVPLHLAPGVIAEPRSSGFVDLFSGARHFLLAWHGSGWSLESAAVRVSPSYGIALPAERLVWRRSGKCGTESRLNMLIIPHRLADHVWTTASAMARHAHLDLTSLYGDMSETSCRP